MNKYAVMNTLFSALGGAIIGGAVTFVVTKKHFEAHADEEIEKVRLHYALIRKDQNSVNIFGSMPTEESSLVNIGDTDPSYWDAGDIVRVKSESEAETHQLIEDLGYSNTPVDDGRQTDDDTTGEGDPVSEESSQSIFDKQVSEDEVGEEIEGPQGQRSKSGKKKVIVTGNNEPAIDPRLRDYVRRPGEPYVISQADMFNTETEWEKPTLSYYEGDDTLVDERNSILDETHRQRYVGDRHLSMFGVLSEDENIVYVRSPQISTDFEILLEPGKYSVRVLGEPDYEAAQKQRVRRMRDSD